MQAYNVPGVSLAVINNYTIEWAKGYGITDVIQPTPITVDTRFYAASISKPLAAMAALALVQAGLLDLDENINRKLVSWGVPENGYTHLEKVTLRRLLSHSAGLEAGFYSGYGSDEAVPTLRQLLEGEPPSNSGPVQVTFVPGSQAAYSGPGYWVLQQLLEDVTGQTFAVLLDQSVCQKLGLLYSTFHQPLPQVHAVMAAAGHDASGRPIEERDSRHPGLADGGLWSTPSDLARFLIELQLSYRGGSNKVLSQAITQEMLAKQIDYHGLGLHLFGDGPTMRLSHGGEGEGFQCLMAAFRETGQGAVAMANGINGYP
jgi:CubicO group peptidase (beta-lactamase class C family)